MKRVARAPSPAIPGHAYFLTVTSTNTNSKAIIPVIGPFFGVGLFHWGAVLFRVRDAVEWPHA